MYRVARETRRLFRRMSGSVAGLALNRSESKCRPYTAIDRVNTC